MTGASRGIGRAIAERLGRDGASLVVNYAGSTETIKTTVTICVLDQGRYQDMVYQGSDRIISPIFPNLNLTAQVLKAEA